jgi:hypothetical protein
MPTQARPEVKVGDILKCTNEGTRIFRGIWDAVDYVIPPFAEDFMPFEAVKLFFGDPRSTDKVRSVHDIRGIVGFLPDRPAEVRRLRLLYDHGFGDYTGKEGPDVVWEKNKIPAIKVETLKGERVWTVIDDPEGTTVLPAATTVAQDDELRTIVRQQGQLIRSLMDRIGVSTVQDVEHYADPPKDNVYDPEADEIIARPDEEERREPTLYDQLPEDR